MHTPRRTPGDETRPPDPQPTGSTARRRHAHAGAPAVEHTGQRPPRQRPRPGARGRLLPRPRTVRAKIISLLMVPVLSLLALWGFATVTTAQDVARLRQLQRVDEQVGEPVAAAVAALQIERRAALHRIAAPSADRAAALRSASRRTDDAVRRLRLDYRHTVASGGEAPRAVAARLDEFVALGEKLGATRKAAADDEIAWNTAYEAYNDVVAAGLAVGGAVAGIHDSGRAADARVLLELDRAAEMLAREDVLVASARLTGSFDAQQLSLFTGTAAARTALTEGAATDLRGPARATWRTLSERAAYRQLTTAERRVTRAPAGRAAATAVPPDDWERARAAVSDGLRDIAADARRGTASDADPVTGGLLTAAGAAVVLGLVAVAASLVISVRIGRALVVELVTLRNSALEIARRKLPHAMRRLRTGEQIDIRAEVPPDAASEDEIGQVGEALASVHRAALSAAVERAELAGGISGVFVNLARRSQTLVHRQLALLDAMERRADDPGELGDLFRLDHLTTRMRRHAESLIILSGAAPGRAWSSPVPLTSVVRAAVSEIEDYARVELRQLPETAVSGAAVADLTHLLAELVENAAQFSPPHTKVRITGEPVGNGYALEVEDRGLGMGKEALAEANRKLEESQALDLFDSDRLGLFVVSRLASRHGIKVRLRTSPYGGSTAVVLLPKALLQGAVGAGSDGRRRTPEPLSRAPRDGEQARSDHEHSGGGWSGDRSGGQTGERPVPGLLADRPRAGGLTAGRERPRPVPRPVHFAADTPAGPEVWDAARSAAPERPWADARDDQPAPPGAVRALRLRDLPEPSADGEHPLPPAEGRHTAQSAEGQLPRRVRQSHLAPQLRQALPPAPPHNPPAEDMSDRSPEVVRDRMNAYRNGWTRGGGAAPGSPLTAAPDPLRDQEPHPGRQPLPGSEGDRA
ncbi:sensor histidine kinase [Streptomyces sp. ISL-10]|uniref:sensor histidine kinase n=1 Tax=Streptomyces sp. ISL-10 TaxID=2819172 RepID=UPI001BE6E649|nr:nitrate- and nitrite sensing domain-containing protein [Streptomyces sp. ISL-10]MBT2365449.1 sensor histidine kinase [Streptomyces sp. ISL-10]